MYINQFVTKYSNIQILKYIEAVARRTSVEYQMMDGLIPEDTTTDLDNVSPQKRSYPVITRQLIMLRVMSTVRYLALVSFQIMMPS